MFGLNISAEDVMKLSKRSLFPKERTISEVTKDRELIRAEKNLVQRIIDLEDDQYLVIPNVVPKDQFRSRLHFLKKAEEVGLPTKTLDELKETRPADLIKEAYDSVDGNYHAGLSFQSYLLKSNIENYDGLITRMPLVAMLGGDRLFTYSEQSPFTGTDVKPYTDTSAVETLGGKFVVGLPSRTQSRPRYRLTYEGIPMDKCGVNHIIWSNMITNHSCPTKIHDFSYRHGHKIEWCEHEVAGYLALAYSLANQGDTSALEYSPIMRPTQFLVDFGKKMLGQVIVEDIDEKDKKTRRRMNRADHELFLQHCTRQQGVDECWEPLKRVLTFREYV
ncbi:hypothetical protein ACFL96_10755 [Thermoproteota archaeon]